ncbi:MAG: hypothetical protein MJ189_04750, partial [Coriobacteriales bacterium]|nr:hypothetical protein [Coriobacteriales bacterium]
MKTEKSKFNKLHLEANDNKSAHLIYYNSICTKAIYKFICCLLCTLLVIALGPSFTILANFMEAHAESNDWKSYAVKAANTTNEVLKLVCPQDSLEYQNYLTNYANKIEAGENPFSGSDYFDNPASQKATENYNVQLKTLDDILTYYKDSGLQDSKLSEFKPYMSKSIDLRQNWQNAVDKYNAKMQEYIEGFNNKITEYENEYRSSFPSEPVEGIDLTNIYLIYDAQGNIIYTDANEIPAEYQNNKWVIIKKACLDGRIWSEDTIAKQIYVCMFKSIQRDISSGYFEAHNFDELDRHYLAEHDYQQILSDIATDAYKVLTYRFSLVVAKQQSSLAKEIVEYVKSFCNNDSEAYITALKDLMKACAFVYPYEYNCTAPFKAFICETAIKFSEYIMFAQDLIRKGAPNVEDRNLLFAKTWNENAEDLYNLINTSLTGSNDYCYIVKSRIKMVSVPFKMQYKADSYRDGVITTRRLVNPNEDRDTLNKKDILTLFECTKANSIIEDKFESYLLDNVKIENEYLGDLTKDKLEKPSIYLIDGTFNESKMTNADDLMLASRFSNQHPFGEKINAKDINFSNFMSSLKLTVAQTLDKDNCKTKSDLLVSAYTLKSAWEYGYVMLTPDQSDVFSYCGDDNFSSTSKVDTQDFYSSKLYSCTVTNEHNALFYALERIKATPNNEVLHAVSADFTSSNAKTYNFLEDLNKEIESLQASGTSIGAGSIAVVCGLAGIGLIAIIFALVFSRRKKSQQTSALSTELPQQALRVSVASEPTSSTFVSDCEDEEQKDPTSASL